MFSYKLELSPQLKLLKVSPLNVNSTYSDLVWAKKITQYVSLLISVFTLYVLIYLINKWISDCLYSLLFNPLTLEQRK